MTKRDKDAEALEALFSAGRDAEAPREEFMAQLMADAAAATTQNIPSPDPHKTVARPSFWSTWLPISGLTAATCAGLWIGIALPHSDFGTAYLAELGATSAETDGFAPSFGVSMLLEDVE